MILLPHSFVNKPSLNYAIFIMLMFLLGILILHYCWTDIFAFISLWTISPLFPLRTWLLHIGPQEVLTTARNSPITSSTYKEFLKEHGSNVLGRTPLTHWAGSWQALDENLIEQLQQMSKMQNFRVIFFQKLSFCHNDSQIDTESLARKKFLRLNYPLVKTQDCN